MLSALMAFARACQHRPGDGAARRKMMIAVALIEGQSSRFIGGRRILISIDASGGRS
jgi:hypothetical protein